MSKISSITAREILDSRGNPTIETTVCLDNGILSVAGVPAGASIGTHEAVELRDKDPNRYMGLGVLLAVNNVNTTIASRLVGNDADRQKEIDQLLVDLDGTENKTSLGANSLLSVSLATALAAAKSQKLPFYRYIQELSSAAGITSQISHFPTPTFNIINGGKHGAGNLDFQEFHVVPAGIKPFQEALRAGVEIYHSLKQFLVSRDLIHSVGDEGGFAPNLFSNLDACEALVEAIKMTHYKIGSQIFFGLDLAANHFFQANNTYQIKDKPEPLSRDEFISYILELNNQYHAVYLEDPLFEDDWDGWEKLTREFAGKSTIIGDDLLVTNPQRLERAIKEQTCTGIIIKPNQIGTLSETLQVVKIAKDAGFKTMVSHRSGETNDDYLADLAVGLAADYIKFGAPARGERVAKYNRLLTIEAELHEDRK